MFISMLWSLWPYDYYVEEAPLPSSPNGGQEMALPSTFSETFQLAKSPNCIQRKKILRKRNRFHDVHGNALGIILVMYFAMCPVILRVFQIEFGSGM